MTTQHEHLVATFNRRLAAAAAATEDRLEEILQARAARTPERLAMAMRHATLGGGKRFRAFLVIEGAALACASAAAARDVAAALECVHAYSLVHDDLPAMDNDEVRRGRPTVWKAYGDWTAILAGDALLTLAFEVIAASTEAGAEAKAALIARLAIEAGDLGMVGGQVLDLEADKLGKPAQPSLAHIDRLQAMKTGALIAFAAEAGPILAGPDAGRLRAALATYARHLGLAFQLSDDLLDAEGDAHLTGKAVGKDAIQGKATHVSLLGVDGARRRLDTAVARAIGALDPYGSEADALRGAALFMLHRDA